MNLFKIKYIRGLFKAKWFPIVPQLIMLVVFILLIIGGLGVTTDDSDFTYWLRNTNFSNLIIWSYWWPVIIIAAVFLGRFWCTVCPVELITYWASRIGLRLRVPRILRSGWIITIFYILVWTVGVYTLGVNRIPHRMSLYMLLLVILAIDISLIFRKRAFCSYVCPVGHLLGLYALMSPFEWRADDLSICKNCKTKDCVVSKNHYRLLGRSCTSNLYPATIKDNRNCLLCAQCLKACPHDNIRFSMRRPFADFFSNIDLKHAQVAFIFLVGGVVIYEILSQWSSSLVILNWLPYGFTDILGLTGTMANLVAAIIMFILLPSLAILAMAVLAGLVTNLKTASVWPVVKMFALLLLPTIAAGQIIKSILKMSSRIPYLRYAISDPKGIETAQKIADGTLIPNQSVTDALYPVVSFAAAVVLIAALTASVQIFCKSEVMKRHNPGVKVLLYLSVLVYWGIFGWTILRWRFG